MGWFEAVYRTRRLWPGTPLGEAATGSRRPARCSLLCPGTPSPNHRAGWPLLTLLARCARCLHAAGRANGHRLPDRWILSGADADLIVGDLLLDLKATATATKRRRREDFLQLIGYVLLDYDDRYGIRVGIY